MRVGRNLYVVVAGIVACGLFAWGLAGQQEYGSEEGWLFAGYLQHWGPVVPVCYVVGAVGVILLGCYWLRLARAITSIAELLKNDKESNTGAKRGFFAPLRMKEINELCTVVTERFESYTARIAEFEKQIKELQIQIQLSQRKQKNIEAIIYSIRDAVVVVDEFDKLMMANEAAGRLFNFDFKSSQQKPLRELIGVDQSEFLDFLSHSIQSKGQAARREIKIADSGQRIADSEKLNVKRNTLNAKERAFDCIVSCVYDRSQQVCGAVAVLHDITREKEISQMKNDFVSHVSHELKTPLASITAYSEMLADGEADDKETRKEFYSVIQNQAKRLNRLIEDILNTSRIESGLIKINKEPISLTILIEEQLQMIRSYAEEKNIKVVGQKPIIFDQVYVDRDMISQVIVNLLSNAVKYTRPGGSVKVETEVDEVENLVRVNVTDTGIGIPEDEIEHVFDKFYRVDANNKQAKGTGLGLNLVKQIVEKVHGGRVFVTSQVGVGSTFGFELPLATRQSAGTG